MAITFTWSVKDMHRVADTGAVYKVDWSCSGVDADTGVSHSRSGTYQHKTSVTENKATGIKYISEQKASDLTGEETEFNNSYSITDVIEAVTRSVPSTPDHTAAGFKAYADLTEADVLAWCKADGVGAKNEALITSNITNKIAAQANSTGMPWAAE